jgi:peroxiredoxin
MSTELPEMTFMCRNAETWNPTKSIDIFTDKKVIVFSVPAAFDNPQQLYDFEAQYKQLKLLGFDEVYVSAVNDAYVMNAWTDFEGIADNAQLADFLGMSMDLSVVGMGKRSRRFAAIIENNSVKALFIEPRSTREVEDPYGQTSPNSIIDYLEDE